MAADNNKICCDCCHSEVPSGAGGFIRDSSSYLCAACAARDPNNDDVPPEWAEDGELVEYQQLEPEETGSELSS